VVHESPIQSYRKLDFAFAVALAFQRFDLAALSREARMVSGLFSALFQSVSENVVSNLVLGPTSQAE
jgi:hypothetical protein